MLYRLLFADTGDGLEVCNGPGLFLPLALEMFRFVRECCKEDGVAEVSVVESSVEVEFVTGASLPESLDFSDGASRYRLALDRLFKSLKKGIGR